MGLSGAQSALSGTNRGLLVNTILIAARIGLAGVFLLAAITKLVDMSGSRRALGEFGVPARLLPVAAVTLPVAEILTAVLLISAATAQAGAVLAVILLLSFVVGISAALRRGAAPDCHCFGQLHSRPAGKETLVRNGVLIVVGLFVLLAGAEPGVGVWLRASSAELVALAATSLLVVVLAYAWLSLWVENRRLTGHGPQASVPPPAAAGQMAPRFSVRDLAGASVSSADLLDSSHRTVLVFTSATCGPCVGLLPELARWRQMLLGRLAVHVVASGDEAENRRLSEEHGVPVFLDRKGSVGNAFGTLGTPSAIEVDPNGRVTGPPAIGAPAIEGLIRAALKRPASPSTLQVRQVAAAGSGAPSA